MEDGGRDEEKNSRESTFDRGSSGSEEETETGSVSTTITISEDTDRKLPKQLSSVHLGPTYSNESGEFFSDVVSEGRSKRGKTLISPKMQRQFQEKKEKPLQTMIEEIRQPLERSKFTSLRRFSVSKREDPITTFLRLEKSDEYFNDKYIRTGSWVLGTATFSNVKSNEEHQIYKCENKLLDCQFITDAKLEQLENLNKGSPAILEVREVIVTAPYTYIVCEQVFGKPLFQMISRLDSYSEEWVRNVIRQLVKVVQYLHTNKSIRYQTLLPEVIFVSDSALDVKVLPFYENKDERGFSWNILKNLLTDSDTSAGCWYLGLLSYILLLGFPPYFICRQGGDDPNFLYNNSFWYYLDAMRPDLDQFFRATSSPKQERFNESETSLEHLYAQDFRKDLWEGRSQESQEFTRGLLTGKLDISLARNHSWLNSAFSPSDAPLVSFPGKELTSVLIHSIDKVIQRRKALDMANVMQPSTKIELVDTVESDENSSEDGGIFKKGWMEIKSWGTFTSRYFVATARRLEYYKSPDDKNCFGLIDLMNVKACAWEMGW
eukprot:TRINITY_DN8158_c0_g1_i2.p1 TRINITY_DN8158_c0_g1~~TRINITY_DN8158_c0_g1_i2.p1  ORF type:complete len:548 (-),score=149.38 TRINITY_DN8158_c0_g1_i2:12-1655(-)